MYYCPLSQQPKMMSDPRQFLRMKYVRRDNEKVMLKMHPEMYHDNARHHVESAYQMTPDNGVRDSYPVKDTLRGFLTPRKRGISDTKPGIPRGGTRESQDPDNTINTPDKTKPLFWSRQDDNASAHCKRHSDPGGAGRVHRSARCRGTQAQGDSRQDTNQQACGPNPRVHANENGGRAEEGRGCQGTRETNGIRGQERTRTQEKALLQRHS